MQSTLRSSGGQGPNIPYGVRRNGSPTLASAVFSDVLRNVGSGSSTPEPEIMRQRKNKKQSRKRSAPAESSSDTQPTRRRRRHRNCLHLPRHIRTHNLWFLMSLLPLLSAKFVVRAKKFEFEARSFCCTNGEVRVVVNAMPDELDRMFRSRSDDALHFQVYSRLYNNLFASSSALGGTIDCKTHKGIYAFRLHGQIYHYLPNLLPNEQGHVNRSSIFQELQPDMIHMIMQIMDRNPYAKFFRGLQGRNIDETTRIRISKNPCLDQRVYNAPTVDEVAAIWSGQAAVDDNEGSYIAVYGKSEQSYRNKHYYACYDALQYPLLFPYGESGWHPGIPRLPRSVLGAPQRPRAERSARAAPAPVHTALDENQLLADEETLANRGRRGRSQDISCREYYACLLQIREGIRIISSGRLFLQFVVDMYVKIENTRLDFLRKNQATIRADLYQGLLDSIENGETRGENCGRRIILPPSFIGGPRDLRKRYLNAIALV